MTTKMPVPTERKKTPEATDRFRRGTRNNVLPLRTAEMSQMEAKFLQDLEHFLNDTVSQCDRLI